MYYPRIIQLCLMLIPLSLQAQTTPEDIQRAVWANEAIVSTYTYNHHDFMARQKDIAQYFTAQGWINYSKALQDSKLPETIQKNTYDVSAVATMPPTIKALKAHEWQAIMPILVIYKNPSYKQQQNLNIMITFTETEGTGVRGLSITNLQSKVAKAPCQCVKESSLNAIA